MEEIAENELVCVSVVDKNTEGCGRYFGDIDTPPSPLRLREKKKGGNNPRSC